MLSGLSSRWHRATGAGPSDDSRLHLGPLGRAVRVQAARVTIVPRRLRAFPFTKPSWPSGVDYVEPVDDLGVNYETEWARTPAARAARNAIVTTVIKPGLRALAQPTVRGLDRIEHLEGPVVFAANHHSHVDTFLLLSSVPRRFRERTVVAAASDYFFDTRMKAAAAALGLGAIPIERHRVNRRSSDQAQALLADGWNLVIFPEGGRSPDGWGQEWKPGAAFLAIRAGCPVVPVHLEGTGRIAPRNGGMPKRGETIVTFGHPLLPTEGEDARRFGARISSAVAELGDEATSDWWSARRRAARGDTPALTGPDDAPSWRRQWALAARDRATEKPARRWP